jgi:phosphoribosylformylglycinamidine cyclo-ligase
MGCVGATGPFLVSSQIDRNQARIPGSVISKIINENQAICDLLTQWNIPCYFSGGETADVGDLVRTITLNNTMTARMRRSQVIDAGRISAPAVIVGFSSTGQAAWETEPNSGMGSNGLTNARHDVLARAYRTCKETYAPETPRRLIYCGDYVLFDRLPGDTRFTIGSALLSPTRTYLPLLFHLFETIGRKNFLGLIHCSGGGQTKAMKFGQLGIQYVKHSMFPVPPLFALLKNARNLSWREMYTSYNMGHRLEAVVRSEDIACDCIDVSNAFGITAEIIGEVVPDKKSPNTRKVHITCPTGEVISYSTDDE